MTFTFFLPILTYPDASPKGGLAQAFAFVRSLDGQISVMLHEVDIPPLGNPLANVLVNADELAAAAETKSRDTANNFCSYFRALNERYDVHVEMKRIKTRYETVPDRMAEAARHFDFALISPDGGSPEQMSMVEAVLFGSGGPVLLFPPKLQSSELRGLAEIRPGETALVIPDAARTLKDQTIAIAWDGSRPAARAVRDSLPLLLLAKEITIITIEGDKDIPPDTVTGLHQYLSAHDVRSKHLGLGVRQVGVGEQLQQAALNEDAALLVMGAYGHSRLRELVLGGATRVVVRKPLLPVLLSH
jgi:nucleotide-binding universal stress UspA family protein